VAGEGPDTQPSADDLVWRWHDNPIYGLRFDIGDPEKQDWRSDLVFDIDFITDWLCEPSGEFQFWVAPATLVFHDVTDLGLAIDHGNSDGRNALTEWSIDRLDRERLHRPFEYWRWTIRLTMPPRGQITFCASGFTQTLRGTPRRVLEQRLPRTERRALDPLP
jgi:hypothetical protein